MDSYTGHVFVPLKKLEMGSFGKFLHRVPLGTCVSRFNLLAIHKSGLSTITSCVLPGVLVLVVLRFWLRRHGFVGLAFVVTT